MAELVQTSARYLTLQELVQVADLRARRLVYFTKWERNVVKNAFARAGFERTGQGGPEGGWNGFWGKHPTHRELGEMNRFQKVNHFPA